MKQPIMLGSKGNLHSQIRPQTVEQFGEPTINYDGLTDLFYGHFGVPREKSVIVDMYSGMSPFRLGYYNLLRGDTIHINVRAAEPKGLTTEVILHEGKHLADHINHRARSLGLMAIRIGVTPAATTPALIPHSPNLGITIAQCAIGLGIGQLYAMTLDPYEKAGQRARKDPVLKERYANVIVFPNSAVPEATNKANDPRIN